MEYTLVFRVPLPKEPPCPIRKYNFTGANFSTCFVKIITLRDQQYFFQKTIWYMDININGVRGQGLGISVQGILRGEIRIGITLLFLKMCDFLSLENNF